MLTLMALEPENFGAVHTGVGPGLVIEVVVEGVVEATVELLTVELCGAGDAVDRGEDRINLLLVGRTFVGGETCFVGRLTNQRLEFDQEVVDLLKTTLGDVDHLLGPFGIADGGVDGGFFSSEAFRGDEAGGLSDPRLMDTPVERRSSVWVIIDCCWPSTRRASMEETLVLMLDMIAPKEIAPIPSGVLNGRGFLPSNI